MRGCADGRMQQQYMHKEEVSSLTVSLEVMMMSYSVDAKEGSYVVVTEILVAFLHAYINDTVYMVFEVP